jgi:hypothetical protein
VNIAEQMEVFHRVAAAELVVVLTFSWNCGGVLLAADVSSSTVNNQICPDTSLVLILLYIDKEQHACSTFNSNLRAQYGSTQEGEVVLLSR